MYDADARLAVCGSALMEGRVVDALTACAAALLTVDPLRGDMIDSAFESLRRLGASRQGLDGLELCERLLLLAAVVRCGGDEDLELLRTFATPVTQATPPLAAPVIIVAGACDPDHDAFVSRFGPLLQAALRAFEGTVISGGTTVGIARLVGDAAQLSGRLRAVGYVPHLLPEGTAVDRDGTRYTEIRVSPGHGGFGAAEPLQYWTDILAAGIDPAGVRVLGIGGGKVSALEFRTALVLGAGVGVIAGSGREAARILEDPDWAGSPTLVELPAEARALEAFLVPSVLSEEPRTS